MMQATDLPGASKARAALTAAASSPATADLVGAVIDLLVAVRHTSADPSATMPLLLRLATDGPVRACDLAETLHLDQSTVSRHVATMEAEGLVRRAPSDTDRRSHLLALTPEGDLAVSTAIASRVRHFESAVATWSTDDISDLTRLLTTFVAGLHTHERTTE